MERSGKKGKGLLKWSSTSLFAVLFLGAIVFAMYGPNLGKMVGTALGSLYRAREIVSEVEAAARAGKEEGLSAKDTEVRTGDKMNETEKLEVMLVDLNLIHLYKHGPQDKPSYAALFTIEGKGVFTVDLERAKATYHETENQITIEIPKPEFTFELDDSTLNIIAEYQKPVFDGDTDSGYQGYLNSRQQIVQKVETEMQTTMQDSAKECAKSQVKLLAKSVCGKNIDVQVSFWEAEE